MDKPIALTSASFRGASVLGLANKAPKLFLRAPGKGLSKNEGPVSRVWLDAVGTGYNSWDGFGHLVTMTA